MKSIKTLRHRVDSVDRSLLDLLSQRATLVQEIGVIKARNGQSIFVPGRERSLLAGLKAKNAGPLPDEAVEKAKKMAAG